MTSTEARKLKIGDRVTWNADPSDLGTVIDQGYAATTVKWDNGQTGTLHHNDASVIGHAVPVSA